MLGVNFQTETLPNSSLQNSGYSVDYTTGLVTFSAPPGDGAQIFADFEFDVPVRFNTDRLSAAIEHYGISSLSDIPLIEVRA